MALELRPTCENCRIPLPPDSTEAMICSFECTFCRNCVENILQNVCPNCGGGFENRPIRPVVEWVTRGNLATHPATADLTENPVNLEAQRALIEKVGAVPASKR